MTKEDEEVEAVAEAIVNRQREIWSDRSGRLYVEPLELARAAIRALDDVRGKR